MTIVVDSVAVKFAAEEGEGTEDTSTDVETPVEKEIPVPLEWVEDTVSPLLLVLGKGGETGGGGAYWRRRTWFEKFAERNC